MGSLLDFVKRVEILPTAVGRWFRSSLCSTLNKAFVVNTEACRFDLNHPPTPVVGFKQFVASVW
jgi:hypothetical protein